MSDGAHKVKADIEKNWGKIFLGLVKMTFGLVDVGFSLPEGQVVKLNFFASLCPCVSRANAPSIGLMLTWSMG